MPRRSPRNDDVTDSLGGADEGSLARRNPRRGNKPVAYQESQGAAIEEGSENEIAEESFDNDEDGDDSEPLQEDTEDDGDEEEQPRRGRSAKRKSPRNDDAVQASPPRKSSRSNKYTSSMAEPSENSGFLSEKMPASDEGKKKGRKRGSSENAKNAPPESPHKSPARRHARKRLSIQAEGSYSDEDSDHDDESENMSDAEEEPLKIQRIIASRTERRGKWREICREMNTSEIDHGSRWFQEYFDNPEGDDTFEERFLVKWTDLSYLHCSWESRRDLIDQVEGAKTYLSTFFRKSQDGYLFGPDERNDGDFFDPAFTQLDRILEVIWPEDVKKTGADGEAQLTPADVGVVMDKKDDNGTGRQFLVKWGNTPYSDATYEFERDLIWNDVDYKAHVEAFMRRNDKPSKRVRREAIKEGEHELRKLYKIFGERSHSSEEEHARAVREYQEALQKLEFKNGGQLRDYQAEGVAWMLANYVNNRSSILADEMGLGKTLQTVTSVNTVSTKISPAGVFLVVAPLSTLAHWQREFQAWTDLNTIIYHGSAEDREFIRQYEMAYEVDRPARVAFNSLYLKKCGPSKYSKLDSPWMVKVIITTPEMLTADDAAELMAIKYEMVIVDEAHRMKNRNSKLTSVLRDDRFSFHHKMLLTGTPIQNNVSEFWTLLNFCDEEAYDDLDDFLEKYGDMKDKETVDQLHEEIRPYILRRLKEDVEKSVPPKEETLIEVELTMPQKQYYRALYEKNVKFLYKNKTKALDGPSLNNLAMQLRKCCNHVCLLNGVEDELRRENPNMSEADFLVKGSGKLVLLDKLLPRLKEEGHRVLLFSQFKIMLDLIEDYLISRGMKLERIDGSITGQKRQQAIDRFQSKDAPKGTEHPFIMLLSTRAGGQGITLTAADTCIIFDSDWNPQNDLQAQARCHRIGQQKEVKVYRLISGKSYEMQMFHLSSMKMGLDQAVLKGFEKGGTNDGGMSKEEVERLLKHGAYDILNEEKAGTAEAASNEFIKQDIDSILEGRSKTIVHENTGSKSDAAGGTFSKASFQMAKTPGKDRTDGVEVDDPNFWAKILGEKHLKESENDLALKKRQRNQTNYNEDAYQKQLEAALLAGNGDQSDGESGNDSDDDDGAGGRIGWGKRKENDWSLKEAEALADNLMAFGYSNLQWGEVSRRLGVNDKPLEELKRMAFSMILFCILEATETEIITSKKREEKSGVAKSQEAADDDGADGKDKVAEGKVPHLTEDEIKAAAFKKFWDASAEWVGKLVMDVVLYAKDNSARDYNTLMDLLRKENPVDEKNVKSVFAQNVWMPLRSRGWKATGLDGSTSEQQYFYGEEKYDSIDEVLKAARKHHSELSEVIDSVSIAVERNKKRSVEAQEETRQQILSLSPTSATLELLRNVVQMYGPAQLIVDRRKSHPSVRLTRKLILSCSLMASAFGFIHKTEELVESGSTVEKITKCLQIDRRSSTPHPKWSTHHDAVLIYAITKHGWLDSESSCRAITGDESIQWGPPFDRSSTNVKTSDEQLNPPAMVEAVAKRARDFLNENKQLLNNAKTFNPSSLIRTYWLEKHRPASKGDTLGDSTPHEEDYAINRDALLLEEAADTSELAELPTRKELVKRAKTIINRATVSNKSNTEESTTKNDHPYTILDQSNPCNVFLAALIRSMMKAPAGSDLYKVLLKKTTEEAEARQADIAAFGFSPDQSNAKWEQQQKDFKSITENIDTAKRSMARSVRLGKNVLRAIIGEEMVQSKNPNEPLFPVIKARLKIVPVKPKQAATTKSQKISPKKVDNKIKVTSSETAIAAARQKMNSNRNKAGFTVDLTEVEVSIVQAASTHGIPLCDDRKTQLGSSSTEENPLLSTGIAADYTWANFSRCLMTVSKTRLDEANWKLQKANKDYDSLEHKPNISAERRDTIERTCYLAEQNYEAAEIAYGQAADYSSEPETLAKKTIMTLAKVYKHSGQKKPADEDVGLGVNKWLSTIIDEWAGELELVDEHGKTLALTAVDFLKDLSEAERTAVQAVAALDSTGCSQLVSQIALVSRVRGFLQKHTNNPDSLQAHIEQAAMNIQENWTDRPSWWSAENGDFDLLLLKRLNRNGFEGFFQSKQPFGLEETQAKQSFKALGVPKSVIQARARQLVRSVHKLEEQQGTDQGKPQQSFFGTSAAGKISAKKVITIDEEDELPASKKPRVSN